MELTKEFISEQECSDIASLMGKKYADALKARFFEVRITDDKTGVYAQVVLRNKSGSFFYPVDGRLNYAEQNLGRREAGLMLLDYIDLYFEEYLRDQDTFLPIDWADYDCDGVNLQLKGQILNLEIEKMADEFLSAHGSASDLH